LKTTIFTRSISYNRTITSAAELCLKYGFQEEAEEIYQKGIEKHPDDEEIWDQYTKMYLDSLQLETHFEKLQESVEKRPEDPKLWFRYTRMAGFLENEELAKKGIKNLAKYIEQNAFGLQQLAAGYAAVKDYVNAEWAIRESLKLDDTNGMSWLYYGSILLHMGQEEEGLKKYDKASSIAENWDQVATILKTFSPMLIDKWPFIQRDEGEKRVKELFTLTNNQEISDKLVECYQLTKGEFLVYAANRDFPNQKYPHTHYSILSMVFRAFKEFDKAIGILYRSVQLDPKNPDAWEQLGRVLIENNSFGGAAQALMKVREIDSNERGINAILGYALSQIGEHEKGSFMLLQALEVNPADELALQVLPNTYLALGRAEEAVGVAEQGLSFYPNHVKLIGTLAIVAHAAGDKKKSKKALKQCKKLDKQEASHVEVLIKQMEASRT